MKIAILTAGKSAEMIIDKITNPDWTSLFYGDNTIEVYDDYRKGSLFGYKIKPDIFGAKADKYIIATSNMRLRRRLYTRYEGKCINFFHNEMAISDKVQFGEGNIVFPDVFFGMFASVGNNNVISAGTIINHHCTIGNSNLFGTGVLLNGSVNIGNNCEIGSGVIIEPGCNINDNVKIASGAVIAGNIPEGKTIKAKVIFPLYTGEYMIK